MNLYSVYRTASLLFSISIYTASIATLLYACHQIRHELYTKAYENITQWTYAPYPACQLLADYSKFPLARNLQLSVFGNRENVYGTVISNLADTTLSIKEYMAQLAIPYVRMYRNLSPISGIYESITVKRVVLKGGSGSGEKRGFFMRITRLIKPNSSSSTAQPIGRGLLRGLVHAELQQRNVSLGSTDRYAPLLSALVIRLEVGSEILKSLISTEPTEKVQYGLLFGVMTGWIDLYSREFRVIAEWMPSRYEDVMIVMVLVEMMRRGKDYVKDVDMTDVEKWNECLEELKTISFPDCNTTGIKNRLVGAAVLTYRLLNDKSYFKKKLQEDSDKLCDNCKSILSSLHNCTSSSVFNCRTCSTSSDTSEFYQLNQKHGLLLLPFYVLLAREQRTIWMPVYVRLLIYNFSIVSYLPLAMSQVLSNIVINGKYQYPSDLDWFISSLPIADRWRINTAFATLLTVIVSDDWLFSRVSFSRSFFDPAKYGYLVQCIDDNQYWMYLWLLKYKKRDQLLSVVQRDRIEQLAQRKEKLCRVKQAQGSRVDTGTDESCMEKKRESSTASNQISAQRLNPSNDAGSRSRSFSTVSKSIYDQPLNNGSIIFPDRTGKYRSIESRCVFFFYNATSYISQQNSDANSNNVVIFNQVIYDIVSASSSAISSHSQEIPQIRNFLQTGLEDVKKNTFSLAFLAQFFYTTQFSDIDYAPQDSKHVKNTTSQSIPLQAFVTLLLKLDASQLRSFLHGDTVIWLTHICNYNDIKNWIFQPATDPKHFSNSDKMIMEMKRQVEENVNFPTFSLKGLLHFAKYPVSYFIHERNFLFRSLNRFVSGVTLENTQLLLLMLFDAKVTRHEFCIQAILDKLYKCPNRSFLFCLALIASLHWNKRFFSSKEHIVSVIIDKDNNGSNGSNTDHSDEQMAVALLFYNMCYTVSTVDDLEAVYVPLLSILSTEIVDNLRDACTVIKKESVLVTVFGNVCDK